MTQDSGGGIRKEGGWIDEAMSPNRMHRRQEQEGVSRGDNKCCVTPLFPPGFLFSPVADRARECVQSPDQYAASMVSIDDWTGGNI